MRIFKLVAALCCSLHLAAGAQENDIPQLDTFNYGILLQTCSGLLQPFSENIEQIVTEQKEGRLIPANEEEYNNLVAATTFAVLALVRMKQEISCLNEPQEALEFFSGLSMQIDMLFNIMPEDIVDNAVHIVHQLLVATKDEERNWRPSADVKNYRPASEWPAERIAVADAFVKNMIQA